ncbi:MAG: type II toxin-antitoxin system Phd/YefM family antitoxin, partial [Phormidesmis sp. CAN_BIN44]|nr:type II toxin-antitoxin system Phd/YefM family antitoxin [Phormidesmis sp. CAN_BIN44]
MTQYSITQMQENLDGVMQAVEREKAIEITQQGKQVAVLLSMDEYRRLVGERQSGLDVALAKFRQELVEEGLDIDPDEMFKDVRDRSP